MIPMTMPYKESKIILLTNLTEHGVQNHPIHQFNRACLNMSDKSSNLTGVSYEEWIFSNFNDCVILQVFWLLPAIMRSYQDKVI